MEKLNCSYISIGFLLGIISSLHCFSMCGPITFFFLKKKEKKNQNQIKIKNQNQNQNQNQIKIKNKN
ncbi:urease accessory protein UreH domain-containing protein [Candidatus Karelsulcia muelleri]|uniref:urease accessory protein UreH domain-containing protein n=1 Tax=Candidatus Karelsulcia muelleri TaxID=336810 RepID=UPI000D7C88F5|nr:sulfite exporter TauE/SafE family protein [Candidatus Karelsulcia muelleri]